MRGLADKAEAESRDYNEDEDKRHKALKAEIADLDTKITRARDLADAERAAPAILHNGAGDGRYEDRARQFSLVKAINARLGEDVDAGFEREVSAEVKRRSGRKFAGIAVPDEYFHAERRTLLTSGDAASLYPTQHRADLFIDMLRAQLVTGRLGATILDGLVGDQDIPKQVASSAAQWVGEDGALTETDADFEDVSLSPKTVGAMTSYSRRTLINAVPSIENIVRRDLASVIANAIDLQAMIGDGSGNTPTGIVNQTDVHSLSLATPSWPEVLTFIASIQFANAEIGSLGWALNPHAIAKLRGTLRESGDAGAGYLMTEPGALAGYPADVTSALAGDPNDSPPADALVIFGAWSELLIGYWSGVDILVNPYESTAYARGRVLVRAMRDVDVAVRHGESFAFADDLDVTSGE
jgi:HK97 family phage major capsid protein